MNIVIRTKADARWQLSSFPVITLPQTKLPTYIYLQALILIVVAFVLVNWILLFRQEIRPSNPFLTYTDMLTTSTEPIYSATAVPGVNCSIVGSGEREYCTISPSDGPFWHVMGIFTNGTIRWNGFAVRDNTLTLGDLMMLWDRPVTHLYQESALFEWPALGISATGWTESRQFDYHIPITRVIMHRVNR